jgi:hypothetical protein
MVDALQKHHGGRSTRRLGRLYRMWLDYPAEPLHRALTTALKHGLCDLDRIERMVLRHIAGDFFRLRPEDEDEDEDKDKDKDKDKS